MTQPTAMRPLPRGPHELSREEVARSQRERLLFAMADAVGDNGYARTSVADVLARAGVSRATFYELFSDKDDCFRAAYETVAELMATVLHDELVSLVDVPLEQRLPPLQLVERVLARYLQVLHDAPSFAKTFLVEVYAAGPKAIEQRRRSLEHFVDILAETHRGQPGLIGTAPEQRFAVQALVGAVGSMVTNLVGAGEIEQLPSLCAPLMELVAQLTSAG